MPTNSPRMAIPPVRRQRRLPKASRTPGVLARYPDATAALPLIAGGGATLAAPGIGAAVVPLLPAAALVAVAALFAVSLTEEVRISRFIRILEENGFIVLLNPLGACIGACHTGRAVPRLIPMEETPVTPWKEPNPFGPGWTRLRPFELAKPSPKPQPKPTAAETAGETDEDD